MNKIKKIVSVSISFMISLFVFAGCAGRLNIKKVSKNLSSYQIEAVLIDEEKKLSIIESVDYFNNTGNELNSVCFNMYGKAFSDGVDIKPYSKQKLQECFPNGVNYGDLIIKSIIVDGVGAQYNYVGEQNNAVEIILNDVLGDKERICIIIEFDLLLANCTHRLGYNENSINLGNWYLVAAVYEKGEFMIDPYYANGDPFYTECANYDVKITYPSKYTLASSGKLKNSELDGDFKTDSFEAVAVRDFAMCMATDYARVESVVDDVQVYVYAYQDDKNINMYLDTAIKALQLFNDLYGEYPYETLSVAFTDFYQGGMEYPGLVYISDKVNNETEIKKVIVHEIAHEWWYGVVGNNEIEDAWFDEGLAEYSTLLYFENYPSEGVDAKKLIEDAKINYELYLDVVGSVGLKINTAMNLRLNEYTSEYEYVYMIYVKGLLFFNEIRNVLGEQKFIKFLSNIYNEYAFNIINEEGFINQLGKVSGVDMSEFVYNWLSGKVDISQI